MEFLPGDLVEWKSQAQGYRLLKRGIVVLVVMAGEDVYLEDCDFSAPGMPCANGSIERHRVNFDPNAQPRDYESVVVSVKTGETDRAKRTLYHPRSVRLSDDDAEEGVFGWNQREGEWNWG